MSSSDTAPERAENAAKPAHLITRTKIERTDIWVQDHTVHLFWFFLGSLISTTGLLLLWKWIQVITMAKQLAPVLTIVSFILGGGITTLRWFRKRRQTRLEAAAQGEMPRGRP